MNDKLWGAAVVSLLSALGCLWPLFGAAFFGLESEPWVWRTCAVLGLGFAGLTWLLIICAAIARERGQE